MKKYFGKRLLTGMMTVVLVLIFNFILIRAAPGDPIQTLMGPDLDNPVLRAALMERYGLDQPIHRQLMTFLTNSLIRGDLGISIFQNRPVSEMIAERVGATILLGMTGILLGAIFGTLIGIYCARHEGKLLDSIASFVLYIFNSLPSFFLGLVMIIFFATRLGLFPTSGMYTARVAYTGFAYFLDVARHMFLPSVTLMIIVMPYYFRIAKTSVLQVVNEDFVTTFRATGMSERRIFSKYIFRNAILPTITIFGLSMAYVITGVALIEMVFAWPGMGRLVLSAIMQRDYPTILGIYIVLSISVAVVMLIVDWIYALLDPRIRLE
ncbi:MAG: ABC transporter permease [Treponema sp.]|nr:ABC transporter permease [Treponema sp.]